MSKVVKIDTDLCIGCGICEAECPIHALKVIDGKSTLVGPCEGIGRCVEVCPVSALSLWDFHYLISIYDSC